jgi:hypothetical protein
MSTESLIVVVTYPWPKELEERTDWDQVHCPNVYSGRIVMLRKHYARELDLVCVSYIDESIPWMYITVKEGFEQLTRMVVEVP